MLLEKSIANKLKENKLCLEKDLGRLPALLLALFLIPIPLLSGEVLKWFFLKFCFQFQWFKLLSYRQQVHCKYVIVMIEYI